MLRFAGLWLLIFACAAAVVAWNGSRFVGTKSQPRMKDLSFLPPPVVAKAFALGQGTALAKLRWIDSFAYFQYQVDRQDDHVAGSDGRGGFARLYETLIALDPRYVPFYEHAVLNTSGILTDHRTGLSFALLGTLEMPHETGLWRSAAADLAVNFKWTQRNPTGLDAFLRSWTEAEPTELGKAAIWDWRRGLAFQNVNGLETLPWWQEQMRVTKPGTVLGDFVEMTIRELLATHAVHVLPKIVDPPSELMPALRIDRAKALAMYRQGIPRWAPIVDGPQGLQLKCDPFGYPFRFADGKIISPGLEQRKYLALKHLQIGAIADAAAKNGRPPRDLTEASAWAGSALGEPVEGGRWSFDEPRPRLIWPEPPQQAWSLR